MSYSKPKVIIDQEEYLELLEFKRELDFIKECRSKRNINDIDVSLRTRNLLKQINIQRLDELVMYSKWDLLKFKGAGKKQ